MPIPEGVQHDGFAHFVRFTFYHQDCIPRACHEDIHLTVGDLFGIWIGNEFSIDHPDPDSPDGLKQRDVRD